MTGRRPGKAAPKRESPAARADLEALVARVVRLVLARLRADHPQLFPPPVVSVPPSSGTPTA